MVNKGKRPAKKEDDIWDTLNEIADETPAGQAKKRVKEETNKAFQEFDKLEKFYGLDQTTQKEKERQELIGFSHGENQAGRKRKFIGDPMDDGGVHPKNKKVRERPPLDEGTPQEMIQDHVLRNQAKKRNEARHKNNADNIPARKKVPSIHKPFAKRVQRRINTGPIPQNTMVKSSEGTANSVDEIPVMPSGQVSKSHPDYFTINLPFYTNFNMTLSTGETIEEQFIRLDSPYDPIVDGDFSESRQPLGRDTWANIYDFYRVVESDVQMIFTYKHGRFGDDQSATPRNWEGDVPVHAMVGYHVTDDATDKAANPIAFVEMKHSKAAYIHPNQHQINSFQATTTSLGSKARRIHCSGGTTGMSFHYQPEHWDYHVTNLGLQERWTPKNQVPDFTHMLGIIAAYPNNNNALLSNERIDIQVDLYINYKVQWREVNSTTKRTIDAS